MELKKIELGDDQDLVAQKIIDNDRAVLEFAKTKADPKNENGEELVYALNGVVPIPENVLDYTPIKWADDAKTEGLYQYSSLNSLSLYVKKTNSAYGLGFIKSIGLVGNKELLKNSDGSFKRLFVTWVRKSAAGLQICEMDASGSVGINNVVFAVGVGTTVTGGNSSYPMDLVGRGTGSGLVFECILNWNELHSNITDAKSTIEFNTQAIYNQNYVVDAYLPDLGKLIYVSNIKGVVTQTAWSLDQTKSYIRAFNEGVWSEFKETNVRGTGIIKNITNPAFNEGFLVKLSAKGDKELLKTEKGEFKRLFVTWFRPKTDVAAGLQICEMDASGSVGINNVVFAVGVGTTVTGGNSSYPMDLVGRGTGSGLVFECILNWNDIDLMLASKDLKDWVELDTEIIYAQGESKLPFEGINVVHFGDSITADGVMTSSVSSLIGSKIENFAIGGSPLSYNGGNAELDRLCVAKMCEAINTGDFTSLESAATGANVALVSRLKAIDFSKIHIITSFAGVNDYSQNIPLGEDTDATYTTIKGAVNSIFKNIQTRYPHIRIVFITPTRRLNYGNGQDSDTSPNGGGVYLIEYADAIIRASELNHHRALDFYRGNGVNKYNHTFYIKDGVHPNTEGCRLYASRLSAFLVSLFRY